MEYYTVVAESYDAAVKKAQELYGNGIRIHSRRDFTTHGGLFTKRMPRCEIVCYLASTKKESGKTGEKDISEFEKEARTPDPDSLSREERLNTESYRDKPLLPEAESLLVANHITDPLKAKLIEAFPDNGDVSMILSERLLKTVGIAYQGQIHPKHFVVFIGPTGSGKTTTLAKVAYMFKKTGRKVAIVTLDSYRTGAYEQVGAFGSALSIPVALAGAEDELLSAVERFASFDMIFIDTMGLSPKDKELNLRLKGLLSLLDLSQSDYVLTVPASMKEEDIMDQFASYSEYSPSSLAVTKLDETETIGNVLSFSYKVEVPILFFTDGQKVPDDIAKASGSVVLEHMKGFGLDMRRFRAQVSLE